jgi:hypothetical protein
MNKFSKVLFILCIFLLSALGAWYIYQSPNSTNVVDAGSTVLTRKDWEDVQKIKDELYELWSYPDRLNHIDWKKVECPLWDFKDHHSLVELRQNILVFSCILNGKIRQTGLKESVFINEFKKASNTFYLKKLDSEFTYFEILKRDKMPLNDYLPFEGIVLSLGKAGQSEFHFSFTLSFDQKLKYLPQANYFYGQDINQLPFNYRKNYSQNNQNFATVRSWDNIGRFFFVDKLPIRNLDLWGSTVLNEKKHHINPELLKTEKNVQYFTLEEQTQFCASRGMQLLDAATYDASTFYRNRRNYQDDATRSLYYFGDRWPIKNKCELQKTKECQKFTTDKDLLELQISWMGLMSFVEEFESLRNDFDPFFNLHAGSKYFSEKSAWQFLGHRMHWNGSGFFQDDFKWTSSILGVELEKNTQLQHIPIQFRCMKEWVTYP